MVKNIEKWVKFKTVYAKISLLINRIVFIVLYPCANKVRRAGLQNNTDTEFISEDNLFSKSTDRNCTPFIKQKRKKN